MTAKKRLIELVDGLFSRGQLEDNEYEQMLSIIEKGSVGQKKHIVTVSVQFIVEAEDKFDAKASVVALDFHKMNVDGVLAVDYVDYDFDVEECEA
jgi:hypothetical protein